MTTAVSPGQQTFVPPAAKPCGRAAADGSPCPIVANRPVLTKDLIARIDHLYGPRPCTEHASRNDRVLAEVIDRAWIDGFEYGKLVGAHIGEHAARKNATAERIESALNGSSRSHDDRGRQLIVAGGGYTYHWNDQLGVGDLCIGDIVLLPGNQVDAQPHEAVVEGIGSSYRGKTRAVMRLVRRSVPKPDEVLL